MKNLIPHFIEQQHRLGVSYGTLRAYTMFIDLSGFTPLTESLMQQGNAGAEQLSIILNDIFEPAVHLVYQANGFIPYFAGDAFNAIFPIETTDGVTFLTVAQAMRELFAEGATFGNFTIGIKIGLSVGEVEWGIVGDVIAKSFYFRGRAVRESAYAQLQAVSQEIVVSLPLRQQITADYEVLPNDYYFRLLRASQNTTDFAHTSILPNIQPEIAQSFLPDSVVQLHQAGEFRNVATVFISFDSIKTHTELDEFATLVLHQIQNFSGYFKEIDFGDKGGVMLAFFGAPISFENNAARALSFAQALQEENSDKKWNFRIGITAGVAYTGIIGGTERCQYAAVGNRVNLAARLMTEADWGNILTDEPVQKKGGAFKFDYKGNIQYKGVTGNVPTYRLVGRNSETTPIFAGQIIGREAPMNQLFETATTVLEQKNAAILVLYGEAGIGKSRLLHEFRHNWQLQHPASEWLVCQTDQMLRKPLNPFIYGLKNYFGQLSERSPQQNEAIFEEKYAKLLRTTLEKPELYKELVRTKSVLAAQIGIFYPQSLWEQLDARGRYANTLTALSNFFYSLAAGGQCCVVQLEDAHWLDDSSMEMLNELLRRLAAESIFLLITSRYDDNGEKPARLHELLKKYNHLNVKELDLNMLSEDALRRFAESRLQGLITDELSELLQRTTSGNPFYAEQILAYFLESHLLQIVDNQTNTFGIKNKNIKLSDSMQAVLMARVDRLTSLVKETVKAAAVIGREFEVPILSEVMHCQEEFLKRNGDAEAVLREQIDNAEQGQIWQPINELRYIFRHSLLREAVYEMQLGTRLRELHLLIGGAIEKLYADKLEDRYVDLAFHFEQAGATEKTNKYLAKAAHFAKRNYQNRQAIEFYNKLLDNLSAKPKNDFFVKNLLKKGELLQLVGEWEQGEIIYWEAFELSKNIENQVLIARSDNALGHLLLLRGNYKGAKTHLENAVFYFEKLSDEQGIAGAFGNLGNLYFRQGNYEAAKEYFKKSIKISRKFDYKIVGIATIVSNLGLTYMNQGNYAAGIECQKEFLTIFEQRNDRQALATLHTNMGIVFFEKGNYDAALKCYQNGLTISQELGNKLLTSIAIGCIGSVYERTGNYLRAMEHYQHDLQIVEELGDKQGIAIALGLIGTLRAVEGNFAEALDFLNRNLSLCEELGYQKGIAKTLDSMGDIYTFEGNFPLSAHYYRRSVAVSRAIRNKPLMCHSLIKNCPILLKIAALEEAKDACQEASNLAASLDNAELIFEALLVEAQVMAADGRQEASLSLLRNSYKNGFSLRQKADFYFAMSQIDPQNRAAHQSIAHACYRQLFEQTPRHLFRIRTEETAV